MERIIFILTFAKSIRINKSYQRIKCEEVVIDPKTLKSNRAVQMPVFLVDEIKEYIDSKYRVNDTDRLFPLDKFYI